MKIEEGEYIRTKEGKIAKVLEFKKIEEEILNPYELHLDCSDFGICYTKEEIESIKHSKNIIDLIEVGDYVNGKEVRMNYESGKFRDIPKKIKSIVTKEQFKSIEYRLEE